MAPFLVPCQRRLVAPLGRNLLDAFYRRYLDVAPPRPLPFDDNMHQKPAFWAINGALQNADHRHAKWHPRRLR